MKTTSECLRESLASGAHCEIQTKSPVGPLSPPDEQSFVAPSMALFSFNVSAMVRRVHSRSLNDR